MSSVSRFFDSGSGKGVNFVFVGGVKVVTVFVDEVVYQFVVVLCVALVNFVPCANGDVVDFSWVTGVGSGGLALWAGAVALDSSERADCGSTGGLAQGRCTLSFVPQPSFFDLGPVSHFTLGSSTVTGLVFFFETRENRNVKNVFVMVVVQIMHELELKFIIKVGAIG